MNVLGMIAVKDRNDAETFIRAIQTALRANSGDRSVLLKRLYELRRMKYRAFMEDWGWFE